MLLSWNLEIGIVQYHLKPLCLFRDRVPQRDLGMYLLSSYYFSGTVLEVGDTVK